MSNEITVKIKCSLQEMEKILKQKGFLIVDKFDLNDIYYIKSSVDINMKNIRKVLSEYILVRNVIQFIPNEFKKSYSISKLTLKNKNITEDGSIISQNKKDCEISNIQQGKNFLEALGYKNIMTIKEKDIVYEKDNYKLAIKNIENGDNLIEIETIENNERFNTVDKLKERIDELQIPVDTNDYFVKKAEIELRKILQGE